MLASIYHTDPSWGINKQNLNCQAAVAQMVWLDLLFQLGSEQTQGMLPLPQLFKVTDYGSVA